MCSTVQHPKASPAKSPRISVSLQPDEVADLERLARDHDRSVSWLAARGIRFFLSELRRGSQSALDFQRSGK